MLTIDGDDESAVRSASPLAINTGGTYHLGGEGQPAAVTSDLQQSRNITHSHKFILWIYIQSLQVNASSWMLQGSCCQMVSVSCETGNVVGDEQNR